ncbi:MAG: hypothetical protein GX261_09475 [Spirochaetales bacterium]|jgi:hypothetical protein|nr:hypothetical protein [Spirochaetota bacterium]NLL25690.1 hypothetical protein [Spirochaetales bacterium]
MRISPKKTRVMAIVHGKSEYVICRSIKSNLRIKHEIYADKKGEKSIQIDGLKNILDNRVFRNYESFISNYPDIDYKKGRLIGFKLFIIMDLDDCNQEMKNRFKNKEMFRKHWLYDYIEPIYNDPNLEQTMNDAEIPITRKSNYIKIFPTNHGDLDLEMAKRFSESLKKCRNSNFREYVEYCISLATEH